MDIKEALKVIQSLTDEAETLKKKKIKSKRFALISLIATAIFLILLIVFLSISMTNRSFKPGFVLIIVFTVLTLIALELAMIFYVLSKYYYGYREDNRKKILAFIMKESNFKPEDNKNNKA